MLLVSGTAVPEDQRAIRNLGTDSDCGLEAQAVIRKGNVVSISSTSLKDLLVCPSIGVDEKVFWQLAHR